MNFALWSADDLAKSSALSDKIRRELEETTGLSVRVPDQPEFVQTREGKFPAFIQRIGR